MLNNNYAKKASKTNASNDYFDKKADIYADEIMAIQPTFYENTAKLINNATQSSVVVLDIGNGGVVNYKFDRFDKLVCGDLYVSNTAVQKYEAFNNIEFVKADILNLQNFDDATFDTVIVSTVIHHLAESTLEKTHKNVEKAVAECLRVLKPGGQLLIVESVVNRAFEWVERRLYPLMQLFLKICKFDSVYQYSAKSLCSRLSGLGNIVEYSRIDIGPYTQLVSKKVPTRLTPCGAVWVKMIKE